MYGKRDTSMASDQSPSPDGPNTYVLDAESAVEMARLINLDQMTTRGMGGHLAGLPVLPESAKVLDIACGPGGWALDLAFIHPTMEVAGIDISHTMIAYANARKSQGLHNVSFGVMDVTKPLDFSDQSFDLVNGRLLSAFLKQDTWLPFLRECRRILRPGGILRITETDGGGVTSSASFDQLNVLLYRAMRAAGYGFSSTGMTLGITPMLERLFQQENYTHIQRQAHAVNVSINTEAWSDFYRNSEIVFLQTLPMLQKMELADRDTLDSLYRSMLTEMQDEAFCGMWYLLSVWGIKLL